FPKATPTERRKYLDPAFKKFSSVRKDNLRLFPGVRETLSEIKAKGSAIVGYTEAVIENSLYRLNLLDMISTFDRLYIPCSKSGGLSHEEAGDLHDSHSDRVELLRFGHSKPDPALLEGICKRFNVDVGSCVYVGDSMTRDISMAVRA